MEKQNDDFWNRIDSRISAAVAAGPPEGGHLLESEGNSCDRPLVERENYKAKIIYDQPGAPAIHESYEIRPVRCKSWFCPECAKLMGYMVRRKMTEALASWKGLLMITLTIDPSLFDSAQAAYEWVRGKHGLGVFVRTLKRHGFTTGRYAWFLEFQKNGWPHWHVLIEADYIPHHEIESAWGRLRPPGIEMMADRPPFGFVSVQGSKFKSASHAANYATKYLIKEPRYGWPAWVMDFEGRLSRYGVSRGFWAGIGSPRKVSCGCGRPSAHPDNCFCELCREGLNASGEKMRYRQNKTPAKRVAKCGRGSMLVKIQRTYDEIGTETKRIEVIGVIGRDSDSIGVSIGCEGNNRGTILVPVKMIPEVLGMFGLANCEVNREKVIGQYITWEQKASEAAYRQLLMGI